MTKPIWEVLNGCNVCITDDGEGIGLHLSISHPSPYPTWDEIKEAREKFLPDELTFAMLFPPKAEYVNLHKNCFHLYQATGMKF